jgi:hypothetical protein
MTTLGGLTETGNAYTVTVTDASVDAAALNTLDGKTTVTVNAATVGTLTGTAAAIDTAINASTIDTGASVVVDVNSGSATVAQANSIAAQTSGVVTATISETDMTTLGGLTETGNAYTVTVTDASVDAAALNTLDGKTTVTVNAAAVGTLTGTAAAIDTAINASTIDTGAAVVVNVNSGSATVAQANSIDAQTKGVVTATIAETAISTLSGLSGTGNAYSITVNDASVDAGALNTLDAKTTVNVNAGSVGTLTGSAPDIATAISATTIDTGAAVIATVTGNATVAQVNTIDTNTTGVVIATISDHDITTLAGLNNSTGNAYTISVTDASVDAAALNTLDGKTTVNVNAGSVGTLTGTAAAIDTAINASTIDTGASVVVNVNSGSATVAQANSIAAQTTGVVTATISQGDLTTLATLTGTGNAYTVTLSDTTAAASALTTLDNTTTVAVNAGSVATLTGTAAEVTAAYSANTAGSISGLGDEAVTLSDTTLAATALNTVNSYTVGVVNAGTVTTLTGLLADVNSAYAANAANTINGLGDEAVTITNGTGTLLATDLSTAGNATTGTVTVSNTQTVSGTVAEVTAALVTATTKVVMGTASTASISDLATAAQGAPIATTANVTAHFSLGIVDSLSNLASGGSISSNLASITADQSNVVITISNSAGGTVQAADLSAVGNASTGTVAVTNAQTVNGTADEVIAADVTTASKVILNPDSTITASTYNTQDLSGVDAAFTLNVTTINGAVLDATKLATADSVTLEGTNTATGAHADTLGSRLGGTATLNISTDPITANTDLSDLGSGLSLQFGGDTTAVVTGATLTVRQDQVSGYTISGTGTVVAAGTANSDTFDASSITATTNFTSLGGNDGITIVPSALGSSDSIDGGSGSDTLTFSAAGTVVDGAFTNVSSVELLQLAAGTNSVSLGSEVEQAGITTVTGSTGADTLNLLYGTTGLTFTAGTGSDALSYSADSTAQAITLSSVSFGTASGTVSNDGTDSFSGLEAIVGGSGTADSITSTSAGEALILTGANAGTIDGFAFSGVESVDLGNGNDSATVQTAGSLSGNLNLGGLNDTLSYAGYANPVSATLSGANTLSAITAITGGVTGVEFLTLSSNNDTLTVGSSGSLVGNLDFGAGSGDTLSYAGNNNVITVNLNSATSTAAAGATGITGTTSGFERLIGGSGSSDTLNATSGVNTLTVASGDLTTLDTSMTVSAFETINLGAGNDSATISGTFSGTIDLGAGNDTATINNGGSFTSLAGGDGSDTLNLDGANNSITVIGTGAGTTAGTSGGTTTFSGFETVNGQGGTDAFTVNNASSTTISVDGGTGADSLSVAGTDSTDNSLTISGAGSGTLGNVTFAGMESITLGSGNDTSTVSSGGSLSGNLNLGNGINTLTFNSGAAAIGSVTSGAGSDTFTIIGGSISGALDLGAGTDTLSYAGYSSAVSATLSGANALSSSTTAIGGGVTGVENITLSSNNDTFTVGNGGSLSGNLDLGSGSDMLTYSGYSSAVTVSLNSATSTAAGGATGISGTVSGVESLVGGSGSDSLNAQSGTNTLNVAAGGTTTLDTSLTVSGFETINLGANTDASADTATISGAFSGTIDLGSGNDTATINNGGSVTSLAGGAGNGDTLNLDGANQTITVTGTGNGTSSVSSGTATTFSGFETVNGLDGTDAFTVNSASSTTISLDGANGTDSLSVGSDTAANSLTISGAGSGTLGNVSFSGMENIALGSGSDTATVNNSGSLSGNLDLGNGTNSLTLNSSGTIQSVTGGTGSDTVTITAGSITGALNLGTGTDSLSYAGYSSAVSASLSGTNALTSVTAIGGGVTGVENITLSSNNDTFTVGNGGSLSGDLSLGSGTSDSLSYAGYGSAVSLTLSGIASNAGTTTTGGATAISGIVSGFETLTGSSNSDSLVASEAGNTLILTGADESTLDGLSFSSFESVNLAGGNDTAQFTSGDSLSGTLAGGSGTDTLDYSGYGSAVTVNLATSAATGTGGISGFETVLGSASTDSLTANTSGDVNLQGNDGDDIINVTVAGLTSTDTVDGGAGSDTLVFTDAGTITDVQLTNVTTVETVTLTGASTISAGTEASQAGIARINTGTSATTVNSTATGYDLTVNAANLTDNASLTLSGSANTNDFTVTNLTGSVLAGNTSGTLAVTTADAADNAIGVTTGSGATTITASASSDTVTTDATKLGQNTLLSLFGAARQVVTNLIGNITGTSLTGTLDVTAANADDNGISITTGSNDTTITSSGAGDTITVDADVMADNTTLDLNGSATYTVSNLEANTDAAGSSGALTVGYSNVSDNAATLVAGSGNVVVTGGDASDTVTVTGLNSNGQTFSAQASTSNFSFTAGSNNQTISGSNTGSDTIAGGTGTDTLSYAGGSNVDVTITLYDSQAGGSTGQGTDSFSGIESLVGAIGTDILRGTSTATNEVVTLSGANSGTIRDSASSGSFSFSSFEQLDLHDGNDTLLFNNNAASLSANLDLGAGTGDTLSYAGYSNAVSVTLTDISSNTGSTAAGGATAIAGTATGFETLVGGSSSGDSITDSTGESTVAISGANSGTIDGLSFSSIENLNLSTGNDTATVSGSGSGVSLTGTLDLGDGTNSLTMNGSAGTIAAVSSGTGDDTFSISAGSVSGAVSASDGSNSLTISGTSSSIGSYSGGSGADSVTLSGGNVVGNVSTTTGNDTVLISSTSSTIGGNLDFGGGTGDTLSYAGYSNAVSVTLTNITSSSGSTAAGGATAISGTASGFENLVGGSNSGDTLTDSTGNSTIVISGANSGTIDGLTFSAIENLSLSSGIDAVTVQSGGSLSANLNLGDGTSNTVQMNSGAGAIGSLTSGSGNDTITMDGGSVTGAVSTGNGINSLTINNTASSVGSYTGGSGVDTILSKGGDINGNVITGSAADSLTISDATTISGNVTLGTDADSADGGDTLNVSGTDSTSKSVITGSITTGAGADSVSFTDATIGGAGQSLSLGTDNNSLDGNDTLSGSGATITATLTTGSGSDQVSLTSSSLTGDVTLGVAGDTTNGSTDTLTLNASTITGNVGTGSGADSVSVLNASIITGDVTLGANSDTADGGDSLTVTGASISSKSVIAGSIATGGGADQLSFTDATIGGTGKTLTLGSDSNSNDGGDTLTASNTTFTGSITTGSGSDSISLSADSSVDGDVSMGIAGDTANGSTDTLTLNASSITGDVSTGSGADAVSVLTTSTITGDVTLGSNVSQDGADTLTVTGSSSSSKSVITGSISTGAGVDSLSFTDATIGGSGQTISLGNDSSNLDGNDILSANGTAITATISGGSGADTLTLSATSSVDGSITLGVDGDTSTGNNSDSLTLDASTITGNVGTGSGADSVSVLNASTITGDVILGANGDTTDGGDSLTVTGASSSSKSAIAGSIATGGGADQLTFTDATIGGTGKTLTLGSDSNSNDGGDTLTASNTTFTGSITTGSGSDSISLSADSSVEGDVSMGIAGDTSNGSTDILTLNASSISGDVSTGSGADTLTLSNAAAISGSVTLGADSDAADADDTVTLQSGSTITGNVELGDGNDLFHLSTGISSLTSVSGDVSFGAGSGDTLSYASNAGPITVAINSDTSGTATSADASYITGDVSGFEFIIGSVDDVPTSGDSVSTATVRDTIYDNTSASTVVLTGSNQGTIEDIDFFSIENLQLRAGSDILSFRGSPGSPGLITGLADGGGIEGATYSNGVYSGGSYLDESIDLLDYTQYLAGPVSVDLSQNQATGVFGDQAGGLVSGDGSIETSTEDSSFENVDGSSFNDLIIGDNQDSQGNVLRGFGGDDTILGLAGNDTIDGGDGTSDADGADLIAAGDGADLILASDGSDFISGGGYTSDGAVDSDTSIDTLSYLDENEGLYIDLDNIDAGTVKADAGASLSISTFTGSYSIAGAQSISVSTNQRGTDWTDTYGDIQRLVLSNQNDILRIDSTDFITATEPGGPDNEILNINTAGAPLFSDATKTYTTTESNSLANGDRIVIASGPNAGTYYVQQLTALLGNTTAIGSTYQLFRSSDGSGSPVAIDLALNLDPTAPNGFTTVERTIGGTYSADGGAGKLDTLDYSSFANDKPVYVNLSAASFSFDIDANGTIDTTSGEIKLENVYSATNINVDPTSVAGTPAEGSFSPGAFGGSYGVNNFEVVLGGAADDAIVGNDAANILAGNDGADRIAGLAGNDTIYGGKGDDYILPGEGADVVNAGQGINTILITSSDLAEDTFAIDRNGINIFKLEGDGSSSNKSEIQGPSTIPLNPGDPVKPWDPGAQGIDLLDGGDPDSDGSGNAIYDTILGTDNDDIYLFDGTAFKNISDVKLGAGNDSVATAPTSKGIKVSYDGGENPDNTDTDSITLTLTFQQFARLNQSGLYVADVQNYIDDPDSKTFISNQADFSATGFESGGVQVIAPAIYNALQGDPAALIFNSSVGLQAVNASSGKDLALAASALTTSTATASSTRDLVSAFVQANTVKGADAVTLTTGANLSGSATADQMASASAITVDDRSDVVLSAYGIGIDRSNLIAGADVDITLSGTVEADSIGQAGASVVNVNGTVEAAGSRDSSLNAADRLNATISGLLKQSVSATTVDGLALAGLASRTYGIDDANLTDSSLDSVQAGTDLALKVTATGNSQVSANGIGGQSLGPITLVDNGAASTDRFTVPAALWGAGFPLINGDRIRFETSPAGSSLEANRDYFVLNVIPVSGEFQLSSTPAGDPIDVLIADDGIALEAFRPSVANADAISTVTGVDLNRTGAAVAGLQAGAGLNLAATANDAVRATASSVAGDATAGLNRLGGLDDLNTQLVSTVVSLTNTTSLSGADATIRAASGETATIAATSIGGNALAEGNVQVLGSDSSSTIAGSDLALQASGNLSLNVSASTVDGRAEARSGAGAGAGSTLASPDPLSPGAVSGNSVPDASTYAVTTGLRDGSQSTGGDLSLNANGTLSLNAIASTVGGSSTLGSLWSNSSNVLSTFDPTATTPSLIGPQFLADGQRAQLDVDTADALDLDPDTDYLVRLLASTEVDTGADRVTMPSDLTYSDGDPIRFRLNSTTPSNSTATRYGLELGTTYYVKDPIPSPTGITFQLATSPGGAVIDLTPDSIGLAHQLVDADRFQLLTPPLTPGDPYTVATLAASQSGMSLQLPSEATAFSGSRQTSTSLVDPNTLRLAQLTGVDGSGLTIVGGLLSLLAGAGAAISATADGVLNALSRNIAGDAIASAGLVAEGLNEAALSVGSDGTVNGRATINAIADATSTGDNALVDNSLSSLNLIARGIDAAVAGQDISIGDDGVIRSDASIDGRSTASLVSGNADALAVLQADALKLDAGNAIRIGDQGSVNATASIGSSVAPLLVNAVSAGAGNATSQMGLEATGILGSAPTPGTFSMIEFGGGPLGTVGATGQGVVDLRATATDGASSTILGSMSGGGSASITGIRDTALTIGADLARITATATGLANLKSMSVAGAATASGATTTSGILSDDSGLQVGINLADQGQIAVLASQKSVASATSVSGQASSALTNSSVALQSVQLNLGGSGQLRAEAVTDLLNRSESVSGSASA